MHEGGGKPRPCTAPVVVAAYQKVPQPVWESFDNDAEETFREHEEDHDYMSGFRGFDED